MQICNLRTFFVVSYKKLMLKTRQQITSVQVFEFQDLLRESTNERKRSEMILGRKMKTLGMILKQYKVGGLTCLRILTMFLVGVCVWVRA